MWTDYTILLIMVFVAVTLLSMAMFVPAFGTDARIARQLRRRVRGVEEALDPAAVSLLGEKYFRELSPIGRAMQGLPGMEGLARLVEQTGEMPGWGVIGKVKTSPFKVQEYKIENQ